MGGAEGDVRQGSAPQSAARAPRAHKVLITNDFNAAVVQHARLGVFGWPRNHLILGLPMMHALTLQEFRAIVAHEFGHLSGAHGKFGAWIYRLRAGWARLASSLEREQWGKFYKSLFVRFFNWYAPAFAAYSFVQARRQEYEADRVAASVAGADTAAAALVRFEVQAQFLQGHYWRGIFREADSIASPQAQPFTSMRTAFMANKMDASAASTLEAALRRQTDCRGTHPSLRDRLQALRAAAALPLKHALRLDSAATQPAYSLIIDYLRRQGRNQEARPYIDELVNADARETAARKERSVLLTSDKFLPHDLSPEGVRSLADQLQQFEDVQRAWLVCKQTKHYQDVALYTLAVQRRIHWWKLASGAADRKLVQRSGAGKVTRSGQPQRDCRRNAGAGDASCFQVTAGADNVVQVLAYE
ncbi:MAG TPA: M48 family metallopeptidase [Steroidobacter sp.]|nr:M48 family metallopeptidase [Steroidobacter sp.]